MKAKPILLAKELLALVGGFPIFISRLFTRLPRGLVDAEGETQLAVEADGVWHTVQVQAHQPVNAETRADRAPVLVEGRVAAGTTTRIPAPFAHCPLCVTRKNIEMLLQSVFRTRRSLRNLGWKVQVELGEAIHHVFEELLDVVLSIANLPRRRHQASLPGLEAQS
eukprot:707024-Prymnesium_polylepis.1